MTLNIRPIIRFKVCIHSLLVYFNCILIVIGNFDKASFTVEDFLSEGGGGPNFASPPGRFITNDNSNYDKTFHQDCMIIILYVLHEFVQYSFSIQPTTTTTHGGSTGGGWVWTLRRKFKLLTLLNYRQYNLGPVGNMDILWTPWNIFLDPFITMQLFFQSGNKNCHED